MRAGRMWLTVTVLVVIAASAALAYDYTIAGEKPSWWDDTSGCVTWSKAEWKTWAEFDNGLGPVPDSYENNFDPVTDEWKWEAVSKNDVEEDEGILVPGGKNNVQFKLDLGNRNVAPIKQWYLEFELDFADDVIPEGWDPERFEFDTQAFYHGPGATRPFDVIDSDWVVVDEDGDQHLVWWGLLSKSPQPDEERFIWNFDTDSDEDGIDDFHVSRVTTGTCCTPEPVTMALLALGLPAGLIARRRRGK